MLKDAFRPSRRGSSLMAALVAGTAVTLLALSAGSLASMELQTSTRVVNRRAAVNLAESAIHLAIRELLLDQQFGKPGKAGSDTVLRWSCPDEPEFQAQVTFDGAQAQRLGIAPSLNNFGQDAPAQGFGRLVPKQTVQIVGSASYRGQSERVEVLLNMPTYSQVVTSSGPVQTDGKTLVARIKSIEGLDKGAEPPAMSLLPGAIAASNPDKKMELGGETLIKGDAIATGQVTLGGQARVEGQIQSGAPRVPIPRLKIDSYDPSAKTHQNLSSGLLNDPKLSGYNLRKGDLEAPVMELDRAVVFVDGNLRVGQLRGKGAVFVTGNVEITGGTDLSTDNAIAIASKGSMRISGTPGQKSYFQGLIYSEGDFRAENITMVGALVANKQESAGSQLELHNASVFALANPRIEFTPQTSTSTTLKGLVFFNQTRWGKGPVDFLEAIQRNQSNASVEAAKKLKVGETANVQFGKKNIGYVTNYGEAGYTITTTNTTTPGEPFALDFNDLLSAADRIRIIYWKRLPVNVL